MEEKKDHLLKFVLNNGLIFTLYAESSAVDEMVSHPKFIKMRDDGNDVYLSIEDVSAFEILSNRRDLPKQEETNASQEPITESAQQA